jgi:hypothetical protein
MSTDKKEIPKEVGRNLTASDAKALALAGPPCVNEGGSPCNKGDTKCVNGTLYECGTGGWFNTGNKC